MPHPITPTTPAQNWIDGAWTDSPVHDDSYDPATGTHIGTYAKATRSQVEQAIAAAHRAFRSTSWRHDRRLRAAVLNAMADRIEERRDDLIDLLALDNGKIKAEAALEIDMVAPKLRYNAALALSDYGRAAEIRPGRYSMVVREPLGVAGVITPWNSPVILTIRSLAPALAAGCTAVVKLPEQTAQINRLFTEIITQTEGLAPGVLNMLTADRHAAAALIDSPDVPAISFTGSTATGKAISAAGAAHLKRFGLELGGKTPFILFESADLTQALPVVEKALTTFAGQFCMTGSRLLVHRSLADQVRDQLARRLRAVRPGPAADPASDMGPLIDQADVTRVNTLVENAIAAGARPIVRGGPVTDGPLANGAFYRPTLLEVDDPTLPIVQEEVFGPVLTMQVFDTEAEAVALANDSVYGLAASVWSRDVDQPLRVARELEAGTVWINDWATIYDEFEEGGYKHSGQGRLNGIAALEDFTEYKHIALRPGAIEH
ncbi:aldehyde dehydrogenase [Streptomyces sp. F-3]|uniref:Aldehyde dehydrogenase family protein n=2 Tax=Streptomyces TaxID=1883 RepID=A0ABN1T3P6_9ACTN|nr:MULTISPECIES: aldehyde dehydrogenase family protein [unclassified Streptomyces]MDN5385704.1 aldehyde dehydrogenase family protein [Streptomyces sp. LB8]GAT83906.1 aldehyde dehydrogenase [Streptomyces sp. F-3]